MHKAEGCVRLLGLPYRMSQMRRLQQQEFVSSPPWKLEAWGYGVGGVGFLSGLSPWLMDSVFSLPLDLVFPVCAGALISYTDTGPIGLGPTHITLFELSCLFKDPISKYTHIPRHWGVSSSNIHNLRGYISSHNEGFMSVIHCLLWWSRSDWGFLKFVPSV